MAALDTFVSLDVLDRSCKLYDMQKDLDELFCCLQKAMSQKVLSILGLYRTHVMKRIDLQFPRLVYGGESVVFTQYESEVEEIPTERNDGDHLLLGEHLETYYRAILLCEYYADFFVRRQQDGDDYILFM